MISKLLDETYWNELPERLSTFCRENGVDVIDQSVIHETKRIVIGFFRSSFEPRPHFLYQVQDEAYRNGDFKVSLEFLEKMDLKELKSLMTQEFAMYHSFDSTKKVLEQVSGTMDLELVFQTLKAFRPRFD